MTELEKTVHAVLYGTSEHDPMHEIYLAKLRGLVSQWPLTHERRGEYVSDGTAG